MDIEGYFDEIPEYLEFDIMGEAICSEPDLDYFNGTGAPGGWEVVIYGIKFGDFEFAYKDMPKELRNKLDDLQYKLESKLNDQ